MLITSTDVDLISSVISCLHYFCIKLKKRISYIKHPSTFCIKDFYGENNIESLYAASTTTLNNQNNGVNNKQDLNLSVYSQHSSVISTIKSSDSTRQPANKASRNFQVEQHIDDNLCQDLQV